MKYDETQPAPVDDNADQAQQDSQQADQGQPVNEDGSDIKPADEAGKNDE